MAHSLGCRLVSGGHAERQHDFESASLPYHAAHFDAANLEYGQAAVKSWLLALRAAPAERQPATLHHLPAAPE